MGSCVSFLSPGFDRVLDLACPRRRKWKNIAKTMARKTTITATAIPARAPVEKPEFQLMGKLYHCR
jgi:hypothetical protein